MTKLNTCYRWIGLLALLLTCLLTTTPLRAGGNNWVNGRLRADLADIYNNTDYQLDIYADSVPNTGSSSSFTTAWLAAYSCASLADACFFQVGLLAQTDGLHWFVEMFDPTNGGVDCSPRQAQGAHVYWTIAGTPTGCRGAVGDLVAVDSWQTVELMRTR